MLELLIFGTGAIIVVIGLVALVRTRDPLHPLMILGPMLLYVYVYSPLMRVTSGSLSTIFSNPDQLVMVHTVNLLSVAALCLGCVSSGRLPSVNRRFSILGRPLTPQARRRIQGLGLGLGIAACGSFLFCIQYSGGWAKVFSQSKPFLASPSGYIGEMPMLSYPALFILAFAYQGRRMTIGRWITLFLVMLPQVVMATLGGRRGPMFLTACSFAGAWCIVYQRRPRLRTVAAGLVAVGCLMLLLQGNRGDLFRPWEGGELDTTFLEQLWSPPEITAGDEYVAASATILTSAAYGHHYWGVRYFTTFVVRPIPSFIWASKYEDMGVGWMRTNPGKSGIPSSDWLDCVGFEPAGGSAGGFVADLFLEFSWGCVGVSFLLGVFFSQVWRRWVTRGELWTIIYFEVMILSVYLVVQSLGAWLYRVMLITVLTTLFWRWNVGRQGTRTSGSIPPGPRRPPGEMAMMRRTSS